MIAVIQFPSSSMNWADLEHQAPLVLTVTGMNRWVGVKLPYLVIIIIIIIIIILFIYFYFIIFILAPASTKPAG